MSPQPARRAAHDTEWLIPFVHQAVELAETHVTEGGGIPFSGLIVTGDGTVVGEGVNRVMEEHDPTAHAEIVAIRDACRRLGTPWLAGCVLVASGEPCPLCLLAALWARIDHVVFAADRHVAAAAGFDYASSYRLFSVPPERWEMPVTALRVKEAEAPFRVWLERYRR